MAASATEVNGASELQALTLHRALVWLRTEPWRVSDRPGCLLLLLRLNPLMLQKILWMRRWITCFTCSTLYFPLFLQLWPLFIPVPSLLLSPSVFSSGLKLYTTDRTDRERTGERDRARFFPLLCSASPEVSVEMWWMVIWEQRDSDRETESWNGMKDGRCVSIQEHLWKLYFTAVILHILHIRYVQILLRTHISTLCWSHWFHVSYTDTES